MVKNVEKISLYQQKLKYYLFEKIIIEYKHNIKKKIEKLIKEILNTGALFQC